VDETHPITIFCCDVNQTYIALKKIIEENVTTCQTKQFHACYPQKKTKQTLHQLSPDEYHIIVMIFLSPSGVSCYILSLHSEARLIKQIS
jgi:hypothetical protein